MNETRKTVEVVGAAIWEGDRLFAAKRAYGNYEGFWEFPGGKIEKGETPKQALIREIQEELGARIEPLESLGKVSWENEGKAFEMEVFASCLVSGRLQEKEGIHEGEGFFSPQEALTLSWCPGDQKILDAVLSHPVRK